MTDRQQLGGTFIFIGAFVGLLLIPIMEALNPGYSVNLNTLSDLGAMQPTVLLFGVTLVATGLLALIGALLAENVLGLRLTALFCVACIGEIGVGTFPSLYPFKYAAVCHITCAMIITLVGAIAMLLFSKRFNPPFTYISIGLGILVLAGGALMFSGAYGLGIGAMERIMYYPLIIWEIGLGGALMEVHPKLSLRER